jgi:hypothetical protein
VNVAICSADISLTLASANTFDGYEKSAKDPAEGYNYPKPKIPFITGKSVPPPVTYLPPETTPIVRTTTTTPR